MQKNFMSLANFRLAAVVVSASVLFLTGCAGTQKSTATASMGTSSASAMDLYARGAMANQQGNPSEAVRQLRAATAADPNLVTAHELLGDIYEQQMDYADAASEYSTLTRLDPTSASAYRKLGAAQQLMSRHQDAVASNGKAVELAPGDWQANMDLGVANLAAGDVDEAVAYCRRATELAPNEPAPWLNLGVALDTEAHYYEAELAYRKAIELGDTQVTTQLNLITNLLVQRRPKTAEVALRKLLATNNSAAAHTLRGDAMRMLSRASDADMEYRAALKLDPQYYQALNGIAALQLSLYWANQTGNIAARSAAVDLWRQSLAIRSPQPQVEALLKKYAK